MSENNKKKQQKPKAAAPKSQKAPKKAAAVRAVPKSKSFAVIVSLIAVAVMAAAVVGGMLMAGVFGIGGAGGGVIVDSEAISFTESLLDMEVERVDGRNIAATYQDEKGYLHLLYESGSVKSMFIQTLTTPEQRNNLNAGGTITFTSGKITSENISKGITRSTTVSEEFTAGGSITLMVGYNLGGAGIGGSVALEAHYDYTKSTSDTFEKSEYIEVGEELTVEESHSCPLSECKEGYYYAYAAYADFDVFVDVCVRRTGDKFEVVSAEPYYAMKKSRLSIVFVESPNNNFNVPLDLSVEKLPLIDSIDIDDVFFVGDGSAGSPYEVYWAAQLMYIALLPEKNYKLVNNSGISLKGWQWRNDFAFSGTLDGNGKTIYHLENKEDSGALDADRYYGLFSKTNGAVIKNLTLTDCNIVRPDGVNANKGDGTFYAGIVVGYGNGTIENVTVRRTDQNMSTIEVFRNKTYIGGIAGYFYGTIRNCKSEGVKVKGIGNMGALVGFLDKKGLVDNCTVDSYTQSEPHVMTTIDYQCRGASADIGGMVGRMVSEGEQGASGNATVKNGAVKNIDFVFSSPEEDYDYQPRVGYVVGRLQGVIDKVGIPSDVTVAKLWNLFKGFSELDPRSSDLRYFFGAGDYYAGDSSSQSWGWFEDDNYDLDANRPIEAGIRVNHWYIIKK